MMTAMNNPMRITARGRVGLQVEREGKKKISRRILRHTDDFLFNNNVVVEYLCRTRTAREVMLLLVEQIL